MEQKNEWWYLELKELFIGQELRGVPLPENVIKFIEYLVGYFVQEAEKRKGKEVLEEMKKMIKDDLPKELSSDEYDEDTQCRYCGGFDPDCGCEAIEDNNNRLLSQINSRLASIEE